MKGILSFLFHPIYPGFCENASVFFLDYLHHASKKGATLTMAITLSILDRFAKFLHCCKEQ